MTAPIVYLDRSQVMPGRLEELKVAFADLASRIEAEEPELPSYAVYFSDDGTGVSVLHTHRNEASLLNHMAVIGPHLAPFAELLRLNEIEVFGEVGPELTERLSDKLSLLGDERLTVNRAGPGFLRYDRS